MQFNSDKGGVQFILKYMTKSKNHAKIPKLVLLFSFSLNLYFSYFFFLSIWVSFLRTGIGSELCPLKKKVLRLAVTKRKEQPLFFQLFMTDFLSFITRGKSRSL